jgi:hydrogenase nickel incorporation protein HypA/HybF
MLEEQLASDIAQAILDSAQGAGVLHVMQAQVVVGQMRVVNEMLLRMQLSQALKGTVADGAAIELVRPEASMRCLECGRVYPVTAGDPATYACPTCGPGARHTVVTGLELELGEMQALMPNASPDSMANKLARAVEEALGPVEKPTEE